MTKMTKPNLEDFTLLKVKLITGGYISISNYDQKIKPFTDLKSAFDKINIMIIGVKYHYR